VATTTRFVALRRASRSSKPNSSVRANTCAACALEKLRYQRSRNARAAAAARIYPSLKSHSAQKVAAPVAADRITPSPLALKVVAPAAAETASHPSVLLRAR
jgi:hypothetical protein